MTLRFIFQDEFGTQDYNLRVMPAIIIQRKGDLIHIDRSDIMKVADEKGVSGHFEVEACHFYMDRNIISVNLKPMI